MARSAKKISKMSLVQHDSKNAINPKYFFSVYNIFHVHTYAGKHGAPHSLFAYLQLPQHILRIFSKIFLGGLNRTKTECLKDVWEMLSDYATVQKFGVTGECPYI